MKALTAPHAESHVAGFEAVRAALPGAGQGWLDAVRQAAIETFRQTGFPGPKVEDWRYTRLTALAQAGLEPMAPGTAATAGPAKLLAELPAGPRLVFVNGTFAPDLSADSDLPAGLEMASLAAELEQAPESLRAALADDPADSLAALNKACFTDGAFIRLGEGCTMDEPIVLVHLATRRAAGKACHLRHVIEAGPGSRATLVEWFASVGGERYWTNAAVHMNLAAGARIEHVKVQEEAMAAWHTAHTRAQLGARARLDGVSLAAGAGLARNQTTAVFEGEGGDCRLRGIALAAPGQVLDATTHIDHAVPACHSEQTYRNVLNGKARTVFQGLTRVRPGAQHTDAHQSSRNLLLSPAAEAIAKPELEIHADDVKCAHGATVGELDADMLFYLRARGIGEEAARALLIGGFLQEVVDTVSDATLRDWVGAAVSRWLPGQENLEEKVA